MSEVRSSFHGATFSPKDILIFVAGVIFSFAVKTVLKSLPSRGSNDAAIRQDEGNSQIYSLKHGILNIDTENTEMWMNMGYWKDQEIPTDFPLACRSLLQKILVTAKLVSDDTGSESSRVSKSTSQDLKVNILDIGFGCGDQALALSTLVNLGSYVGLTIDGKQFAFAQQRLRKRQFLPDVADEQHLSAKATRYRQIFAADAAKPNTWTGEVKEAVDRFGTLKDATKHESNWVLALDVLYHFSPSRLALFEYAYHDLRASIMAFDLLLPHPSEQSLSVTQRVLLRLVSLLTSTPFSNFLTPEQYRAQLLAAGYHEDNIEIYDISANVFGPLVAYMEWQDQRLRSYGVGIGAFHAARWIFGWWARTGIVRGCVIVARRVPKEAVS